VTAQSSGRQLRRKDILAGKYWGGFAYEIRRNTPLPGALKSETGDRGQDVYPDRLNADLEKHFRLREIGWLNIGGGSTEFVERRNHPLALSSTASIQRSRSFVYRGSVCIIAAYSPTIRYRTAASLKLRNRSLKSELIFMNASGGGGDHEIPGSFVDARGSKLLPECDVEPASRRTASHQARHHHALPIGHTLIIG
jgi:hypothetical protein